MRSENADYFKEEIKEEIKQFIWDFAERFFYNKDWTKDSWAAADELVSFVESSDYLNNAVDRISNVTEVVVEDEKEVFVNDLVNQDEVVEGFIYEEVKEERNNLARLLICPICGKSLERHNHTFPYAYRCTECGRLFEFREV